MTTFEELFGRAPGEGERAIGLLVLELVENQGANGSDIAGGLVLAMVDTAVRCLGRQRTAEFLRKMAAQIERG